MPTSDAHLMQYSPGAGLKYDPVDVFETSEPRPVGLKLGLNGQDKFDYNK